MNSNFDALMKAVSTPLFKSGIVTGDVVNVLSKQSIDTKFDVIIADPPYNIGKDFGNNKDQMPLRKYLAWTDKWLSRCLQLLSDDGVMYVYGFPEILSRVSASYPIDEQRWLIWHYKNKAVPTLKFWQRSHESILCMWKPGNKRPVLEIDQIREPYTETYLKNAAGKQRKATHSRFGGKRGRETQYYAHENGALPRDVIHFPALAGGAGACERWFMCLDCDKQVYPPSELKDHRDHNTLKHPTQKPMKLTKRLIESRINGDGGRVLIPFAGSGSECLVASQMGLQFMGIEINPTYVEFANKWIKEHEAIQTNPKNVAKP